VLLLAIVLRLIAGCASSPLSRVLFFMALGSPNLSLTHSQTATGGTVLNFRPVDNNGGNYVWDGRTHPSLNHIKVSHQDVVKGGFSMRRILFSYDRTFLSGVAGDLKQYPIRSYMVHEVANIPLFDATQVKVGADVLWSGHTLPLVQALLRGES